MTDEFSQKLGERIRELRKIRQVSQIDLAFDTGMSMNTISGIELGKISPKIETLRRIALRLNVSISELFDFDHRSSRDKIIRKKVEDLSHLLMTFDKDFLDTIGSIINVLIKIRHSND